jgi:hypothetical protein
MKAVTIKDIITIVIKLMNKLEEKGGL